MVPRDLAIRPTSSFTGVCSVIDDLYTSFIDVVKSILVPGTRYGTYYCEPPPRYIRTQPCSGKKNKKKCRYRVQQTVVAMWVPVFFFQITCTINNIHIVIISRVR